MIIKANSHLGFNCKDLENTAQFYKEILGCTEKFTMYYGDLVPEDRPERYAGLPRETVELYRRNKDVKWFIYLEWMDGFYIELFNDLDAHIDNPYRPENYGYTHFAFVVDDIHAFHRELLGKGAASCIEREPEPSLDNNYCMWIHDPEGNRMEVQEYGAHSMQIYGKTGIWD